MMLRFLSALLLGALLSAGTLSYAQTSVGIFEDHTDVGMVLHSGSATFDAAKGTYTLRGSGENVWATQDAFQFAWKKVSGDVELTSDIRFPNTAGNEHKKAVLMFRQSLDADAVYVDIALHGNGLLALQYRDEKGALTHEIKSNLSPRDQNAPPPGPLVPPIRLRLTRRGEYVYMSVSGSHEKPHFDGESIRIRLNGDFYAGIGVCAHDKDAVEEATLSNLDLRSLPASSGAPVLVSTLEFVSPSSTDRQVVYYSQGRFEAPNWSRDGSYFLFNREGHLERLAVNGHIPEIINTGAENFALHQIVSFGGVDALMTKNSASAARAARRSVCRFNPSVVMGGILPSGGSTMSDDRLVPTT